MKQKHYISIIISFIFVGLLGQIFFADKKTVNKDDLISWAMEHPAIHEENGMSTLLREMKNKQEGGWFFKPKQELKNKLYLIFALIYPFDTPIFLQGRLFSAAKVMLQNGDTEDAVVLFKKLYLTEMIYPHDKYRITKNLAISYMRLGEQQNCLLNPNASTCIVPLRPDAIHKRQEGSRKAISLYKELLSINKNDKQAQWLLNLAFMTIGEYPEKVKPEYLMRLPGLNEIDGTPTFTDLSTKIGLSEVGTAGGSIVDDFNNDGLLDIVVSSWTLDGGLKFYKNMGDGSYSDETESTGLGKVHGGLNLIHGDYNNDGFVDIFILRGGWSDTRWNHKYSPNSLLKNNGNGTFTDVTIPAKLLSFKPTQTAVFADFDNDGWLDIFVGNENVSHELFINRQDGTFNNETANWNIPNTGCFTKGVSAGDYDNDDEDIYISCLNANNTLVKNKISEGESTFTLSTLSESVNAPKKSFPTWFWDYNNDGWLDIFVAGYGAQKPRLSLAKEASVKNEKDETHSTPKLYRNAGGETFNDVTSAVDMNYMLFPMGANYGDIDNDGYLDMYLGTGDPDFNSIYPNRMFKNSFGQKFNDVTSIANVGHIQKGHGIAFGDIDNDGDQDIFANMGGAYSGDFFQNSLFENSGNNNKWITIRLIGTKSNRSAIGARIKIVTHGPDSLQQEIHRRVSTGGSFGSSSLQQEIGLGNAEKILSLEVYWPTSKIRQTYSNVNLNQIIEITEGEQKALVTIEHKSFKLASRPNAHIHVH